MRQVHCLMPLGMNATFKVHRSLSNDPAASNFLADFASAPSLILFTSDFRHACPTHLSTLRVWAAVSGRAAT